MALGQVIPISGQDDNGPVRAHVNLSTPAGWALLYWLIAVGIITFMLLTV
jgi:hypothetical protein